MHKWETKAQRGSPLLSSPPTSSQKKKKEKNRTTSTSIRPWQSEEEKLSTAALPVNLPIPRPWPTLGLVTTLGASSKPHSSSTSTGRVPESLYPGGGLWPPVSSAQDLLYFREEDVCIICGYIS